MIDDIVKNAQANKDVPRPQAIEIHLDSLDSVRKGAEDFKKKSGGSLAMLINNAGVMASPYGLTKDGHETQIGVNRKRKLGQTKGTSADTKLPDLAHFLLFELVKDCLLKSARETGTYSRVINLSSYGHVLSPLRFSSKAELDNWNKGEG